MLPSTVEVHVYSAVGYAHLLIAVVAFGLRAGVRATATVDVDGHVPLQLLRVPYPPAVFVRAVTDEPGGDVRLVPRPVFDWRPRLAGQQLPTLAVRMGQI